MKKIFIVLMAAVVANTFAQTLTYEMVANSSNPQKELQKKYDAYTASDGYTYRVGDDIVIGTPSSNNIYAYMTSELAIANAILGDDDVAGIPAKWRGSKMKITNINVKRNKKRGASVEFRTYLSGLGGILVQVENTINSGEIISQGMTKEKALGEIKKAKEMLDLELITQQEFDSIKTVCKKYLN